MIGTGKNVKAVYKLKKNPQSKSKFFMFLSDRIYSACQFLISTTFCLHSSITLFTSMAEAWDFVASSAAFSMRLCESLFKVSCNFSSMTFSILTH